MMDGSGRGAYRIKVTIRFIVRRRERFVEKIKKPILRLKEEIYFKNRSFCMS